MAWPLTANTMNRPIKFRAWDGYRMEEVFSLGGGVVRTMNDNGDTSTHLDREVEVMQFTGLHDKNGKEIYEGDIIRNWEAEIAKIVLGFDCWLAHHPRKSGVRLKDFFYSAQNGEVIGNIYENPDLLKLAN